MTCRTGVNIGARHENFSFSAACPAAAYPAKILASVAPAHRAPEPPASGVGGRRIAQQQFAGFQPIQMLVSSATWRSFRACIEIGAGLRPSQENTAIPPSMTLQPTETTTVTKAEINAWLTEIRDLKNTVATLRGSLEQAQVDKEKAVQEARAASNAEVTQLKATAAALRDALEVAQLDKKQSVQEAVLVDFFLAHAELTRVDDDADPAVVDVQAEIGRAHV
jgi:hypothetical protein